MNKPVVSDKIFFYVYCLTLLLMGTAGFIMLEIIFADLGTNEQESMLLTAIPVVILGLVFVCSCATISTMKKLAEKNNCQ